MRQKGFVPILIIVIVVLIGAVGYLTYQNTQLRGTVPIPTQTPVSVATETPSQILPTPKPTTDPTANWKTYTNSQYDFSFKYPNNLELLSQSEGGISGPFTGNPIFIIAIADKSTMAQGTDKPFDGLSVDVVNTKGSFDTYVNDEVKAEELSPRGISNSTIQNLNINTQNWYIDSETSIRRYFLKSDNTVLAISASHFSPNFLAMVEQILSTFKFTQ